MKDTDNSKIVQWPIPDGFRSLKEVEYRNLFARKLQAMPVLKALKSYVYLTPDEMKELWVFATQQFNDDISGIGVELGAGCGLFSCTVAQKPNIQKIYAVEICEEITSTLLPRVAKYLLGGNHGKVIPVVGSFDDMRLDDQSVDFAIEIDSLHHSHDLPKTLTECQRVLKKNGLLICFDRSHPNHVTDEQLEAKLNITYSEKFLKENGFPPGRLTRRENGEHEYRFNQWLEYFENAGFEMIQSRKMLKRLNWKIAAQGILAQLPKPLRNLVINNDNVPLSTSLHWLIRKLGSNRKQFGSSVLGPTDTTLFILRRK